MSQAAPSIDGIIEQAQLPALPQSAVSLLKLSQDPDTGPIEFSAPIEADIGLTSQILRFVNSSYFGFAREIGSIRHAITLVGVRTIKNFALWNAVFSLIPDPKCGPFRLKALWQDSLRRALFARTIAKALKLESADDVFAATLLQDMSLPLLAKSLTEDYETFFNNREGGRRRISELELEAYGWTHAEVGARLIGQWGLPEHFGTLIESHTRPFESLWDAGEKDSAISALASMLPSSQDDEWHDRELVMQSFTMLASSQGADIKSVFKQTDVEFNEFAPLLKLPSSNRSLSEYLNFIDAPSE